MIRLPVAITRTIKFHYPLIAFIIFTVAGALFLIPEDRNWGVGLDALRQMQDILEANMRFATLHKNSFARDLNELHVNLSIRKYQLEYHPHQDQDGMIRRFELRATPKMRGPDSFFADESGIIRSDTDSTANQNSEIVPDRYLRRHDAIPLERKNQ